MLLKHVLMLLTAYLFITCAHANSEIIVKSNIQEATKLIDEYYGDSVKLEKAAELIAESLKINPNFSESYVQAARLKATSGHLYANKFAGGTLEDTLTLLEKAIEKDHNNGSAYKLRGYFYLQQENKTAALASLNQAKAIIPQDIWLSVIFGYYYKSVKDYPKAKQYFVSAMNHGPSKDEGINSAYISALESLANLAAFESDKKTLKSLASKIAIHRHPKNAWPLGNVANYFFNAGMFDEAIKYSTQALEIMNYGAARRTLAKSLYGKACLQIRNDLPASEYIEQAKSLGHSAFSTVNDFAEASDEVTNLLPELAKIYNAKIDAQGKSYKQYR